MEIKDAIRIEALIAIDEDQLVWRCDRCHEKFRLKPQEENCDVAEILIKVPQTNADQLREKLRDDEELAKSRIRREGIFFKALDVSNLLFGEVEDAILEELDWLKQEASE